MSELTLRTEHWSLHLWCANPDKRRTRLAATLAERGKDTLPTCQARFNPRLNIWTAEGTLLAKDAAEYCLDKQAFLFENLAYEFEFVFADVVDTEPPPRIRHPLAALESGFRLRGRTLRGTLQTGNDIGWLSVTLEYYLGGHLSRQVLSLRVYPVKMDIDSDIPQITAQLDAQYPLWRFAFKRLTNQDLGSGKVHSQPFPLFWLAQLARLQQSLERAVRLILDSPHSRLQNTIEPRRADRLNGRISSQLEQRVAADLLGGLTHRYYRVDKKHLNKDTPENRFVKMVIQRTSRDLQRFALDIRRQFIGNGNSDEGRLSTSFNDGLQENVGRLLQLAARPFFCDVGPFTGMVNESLVLHNRHGYSTVYRIWLELRSYLDVAGRHGEVSLKSIAELYEVWCLLALRDLLENLGFSSVRNSTVRLDRSGMEMKLHDGSNAVFIMERGCGLKLRLAHEPAFGTNENDEIFSWTTVQKPDIVLEAEFPDGLRLHWIFDAKYRIDECNKRGDLAPEDAINQMHRYRDALVMKIRNESGIGQRRPILGAFVLYPGFHNEQLGINPYQQGIERIGIGAFPLLPGRENRWLTDFLADTFGRNGFTYGQAKVSVNELQEAARIYTYNLRLSRYPDLTLLASVAPARGRLGGYIKRFEAGLASWYHIPAATLNRIGKRKWAEAKTVNAVDIRYLALLVSNGAERCVPMIYSIENCVEIRRDEISDQQAGSAPKLGTESESYILFKIRGAGGYRSSLRTGLRNVNPRLVSISELIKARTLEDLSHHYLYESDQSIGK